MNQSNIQKLQSIQNNILKNIRDLKRLDTNNQNINTHIKKHQLNILNQQQKLNNLFSQLLNKKDKKSKKNIKYGGNNNCDRLALYQNNYDPFHPPQITDYNSFTNQYRIDGPLPRGDIVPKGINMINVKQNIYPHKGGNKKTRYTNKKNNNKKSIKKL